MWKDHILLIHSSINGHLACLYLLAIVSGAAVNMGVQISFRDLALNSSGYIPRCRIAQSSDNSVFNF